MSTPWPLYQVLLVLVAMFGAGVSTLAQADQAFLRLTGGTPAVVGESQVKGFENWIELDAFAWNATAETSWTKGGGASVGKPNPGEFTWAQTFDASVPAMYPYLLTGQGIPDVTLELVKNGAAGPVTFVQLVMTDTFFTELAFDGTTAHGAIVFKTITQSVWPLKPDGTRGRPVSVTWDIPAGQTKDSGELAAFVAGYGPGNLAPVPEPQTWALLVAGFVVMGLAVRRRGSQCLRQSQHLRSSGDGRCAARERRMRPVLEGGVTPSRTTTVNPRDSALPVGLPY